MAIGKYTGKFIVQYQQGVDILDSKDLAIKHAKRNNGQVWHGHDVHEIINHYVYTVTGSSPIDLD